MAKGMCADTKQLSRGILEGPARGKEKSVFHSRPEGMVQT